jgi:hypothetical protein
MRHVSVPSPFHLRAVRKVSVHSVRRVQSPSRTARDRRPAIIPIKYAARCHGMRFPLFVNFVRRDVLSPCHDKCPCYNRMVHPEVADEGRVSNMEGSLRVHYEMCATTEI